MLTQLTILLGLTPDTKAMPSKSEAEGDVDFADVFATIEGQENQAKHANADENAIKISPEAAEETDEIRDENSADLVEDLEQVVDDTKQELHEGNHLDFPVSDPSTEIKSIPRIGSIGEFEALVDDDQVIREDGQESVAVRQLYSEGRGTQTQASEKFLSAAPIWIPTVQRANPPEMPKASFEQREHFDQMSGTDRPHRSLEASKGDSVVGAPAEKTPPSIVKRPDSSTMASVVLNEEAATLEPEKAAPLLIGETETTWVVSEKPHFEATPASLPRREPMEMDVLRSAPIRSEMSAEKPKPPAKSIAAHTSTLDRGAVVNTPADATYAPTNMGFLVNSGRSLGRDLSQVLQPPEVDAETVKRAHVDGESKPVLADVSPEDASAISQFTARPENLVSSDRAMAQFENNGPALAATPRDLSEPFQVRGKLLPQESEEFQVDSIKAADPDLNLKIQNTNRDEIEALPKGRSVESFGPARRLDRGQAYEEETIIKTNVPESSAQINVTRTQLVSKTEDASQPRDVLGDIVDFKIKSLEPNRPLSGFEGGGQVEKRVSPDGVTAPIRHASDNWVLQGAAQRSKGDSGVAEPAEVVPEVVKTRTETAKPNTTLSAPPDTHGLEAALPKQSSFSLATARIERQSAETGQINEPETTPPSKPSRTVGVVEAVKPMPQSVPAAPTSVNYPFLAIAEDDQEAFDIALQPSLPEARSTHAATTLSSPVGNPQANPTAIVRQVADGIQKMAESGGVELRLSPEELGSVRMHFVQSETGLNVHINAERPETLDLIRRHIDQLAKDLADAGFDGAGFSFGDENAQSGSHRAGTSNSETSPEEIARPVPQVGSGVDGLDIRV